MPEQDNQATLALPDFPGRNLIRHGGDYLGAWLLSFVMFAAADSWQVLTGWGLATLLSVVTGLLAGFVTTSALHEWFHFLGARYSGGHFTIPEKPGLFVYDWDFEANSVSQFFSMSIAGSIGGALSILLLTIAVTADSPGRAAVLAGAIAGFVFAAIIEWPVLYRVRNGADPLAELSKVDLRVLGRALLGSGITALLVMVAIA